MAEKAPKGGGGRVVLVDRNGGVGKGKGEEVKTRKLEG